MDAVKFLEEASRMCKQVGNCINCPLVDDLLDDTIECRINLKRTLDHEEIEDCVKIVEEWANKNPIRTRLSELTKIFPNISMYDGIPAGCIKFWDSSEDCRDNSCLKCAQKFWNQEVVEEGGEKYSFSTIVAAKLISEGRLEGIPDGYFVKGSELYKKLTDNCGKK